MRRVLTIAFLLAASACGSGTSRGSPDEGVPDALFEAGVDAAPDADVPAGGDGAIVADLDAGGDAAAEVGDDIPVDAAGDTVADPADESSVDAADDAPAQADAPDAGDADVGPTWVDSLDSNRNRLLDTYFAFLKAYATAPQSNGLSGSNVADVCDVWNGLDPSSRGVFLTLTARMQGSRLGIDGSSMLWHVDALYRVTGGQDATSTDPGSCGGGEYNRMILSQDEILHAAQMAANRHKGALQPNQQYDIADAPTGTFWRNSSDLGGPHAPFDVSDETDKGAPRGQTQYFSDPASALAASPLGRQDLTTLVDPLAFEMDLDYDCVHDSNPLCSYTLYGPLCLPAARKVGTEIFQQSYGSIEAGFGPAGCL